VYRDSDQRVRLSLNEDRTTYPDLNGDGVTDAVAVLVGQVGGTVVAFAVAMIDHNGVPVQSGYVSLGDEDGFPGGWPGPRGRIQVGSRGPGQPPGKPWMNEGE
jgi:hypothetical protein